MKIEIWTIELTKESYLAEGETIYLERLKHYMPVRIRQFKGIRSKAGLNPAQVMEQEKDLVLGPLSGEQALLILLDRAGKEYTSEGFASKIERWMIQTHKKVIFLIGGAYGFAPELVSLADERFSLSKMTFTHQMVRLFLLEQIYRAMTILRNESYHH